MKNIPRNTLELKVKPDIVMVVATCSMLGVTLVTPSIEAPVFIRVLVGVVLALAGICIVQIAGISFRRAHTTVNPTRPNATSHLITSGIYGRTRNPIYIGMVLILLGWAAFLLNIASFAIVAAFVAYIRRFQIIPEERALSTLFKAKYTAYKSRVRRWI